jgi:site-specific DNA-cytosine methylase
MGAPDSYQLSTSYNESYNAMGDAVVVPVVAHLFDQLLAPLAHENGKAASGRKVASLQKLLL